MVKAVAADVPAVPAGRLIALTDWPAHHPWPSISGLRMLVLRASENGAGRWVRRVGKRVLIAEAEFFAWVEAQNTTGAGPS